MGDRSSWAVTARNRACSSAASASSVLACSSRVLASARASAYCPRCSSTCIRSVWSRVTLAKPMWWPSSSVILVMVTNAQNRLPSLRTRHPSSW